MIMMKPRLDRRRLANGARAHRRRAGFVREGGDLAQLGLHAREDEESQTEQASARDGAGSAKRGAAEDGLCGDVNNGNHVIAGWREKMAGLVPVKTSAPMAPPGPVKSTTKTSAHAGAAASRTAVVDAPTIKTLRKLMYIIRITRPIPILSTLVT